MSNPGLIFRLHDSLKNNREQTAFYIDNTYYTYSELYTIVRKIATLIYETQPVSNTIGIATSNNIYTYAAILACWFSGQAYVPINIQLPAERNKNILNNADVEVLINCTESSVVELGERIVLNLKDVDNADANFDIKIQHLSDNTLMYILFTSGSTGVPKGVPISYKNLSAFVASFEALELDMSKADKCLQMFEFTFDVSVACFLMPLLHGASIYTVPSEGIKYINVLKILKDKQISIACLVPSIITYLKPYFDRIQLPAVKHCILTAEASNTADILKWKQCIPNADIYNLYGPTEATIWCTGYKFDTSAPKSYNEMMAIGKPLLEVEAIIIDEENSVITDGAKGQLCVTGKQITAGYINNPQKNEESFIKINGELFYKTGDLCYKDKTGDLYYCGRMDYQVKVNGHRIELGEIEATVRKLYAINNIATLYRDKDGIDKICLFLENCEDVEMVQNTLKNELPYYMLPHTIKSLQTFPINNSNKIDRIALKALV
ncbi:MAG: amino acid adenylation domain-containing protein [Bacteroidetes bacterium]|nr:amino acid adenylation domain-containing protein [Bacteroidota bacterium]